MLSACGSPKKPEAAPKQVADTRPPILQKYDAAKALLDNKEFLQAAEMFTAIYKEEPRLLNALYNSALAYEMAGKHQEAAERYSDLLSARPGDRLALIGLTRTAINTGRPEIAVSAVQDSLTIHPADRDVLLSKATLERAMQEPEEAIKTARRIIMQSQNDLEALKIIGMAYVDMGKLDMATTFFNNALSVAPDDSTLLDNIGVIQYNKGSYSEALETFRKSLAKNPADPVANANVGFIALKFRDYEKATSSLKNAIDNGLNNCQIYKAFGYAQEGMQAGQEAIDALKQAGEICPPDIELTYDIAKIYNTMLRNYAEAKKLYGEYLTAGGKKQDDAKAALELIKQIEASQAQMDNMPAENSADNAGTGGGI